MAKRPAQESLEHVSAFDSPLPKRARVEDVADEDLPPPPPPATLTNGHSSGVETNDVNGVAKDRAEALEEAEVNEEDEESAIAAPVRQKKPTEGYGDLYLDTINRALLDFDFEKLCSVTLSNINVYACLVCGTYYQGRGPKSQAYFHALEIGHHVYINLSTKKVYVLPEGYEVQSKSLEDIKFVVDPIFSKGDVAKLDKQRPPAWDLQGKKYNPGYVGMNNIKANDYFNAVSESLAHVPPLRNFFMLEDLSSRPELVKRFSTLVRKIWNPKAFKAHVSPHELLQEISQKSNKKFTMIEQADPADFLLWFLNSLHLALGGSKTKARSSIVQQIFQGQLRVESQQITARADAQDRLRFEDAAIQAKTTPFMMLTLDLPPAPLFQDDREQNIIPQVSLSSILAKYNGIQAQERLNTRMRYRLLHPLPPYLVMHIKRFSPNKFLQEQRNPTIVTYSSRTLDMSPYTEPNPEIHPMGEPVLYDLVANTTHEGVRVRDDSVEGEAEKKVWRVQLLDRGGVDAEGKPEGDRWWEIQDLYVSRVEAELLSTKEAYIMIWERRKGNSSSGKGKGKALPKK
ncbi:ubiquitin carboxyl-terminal hydrolase-like protein 2 [Elsinoe australis]|uniref:Ubiquitin carboxyl-terminal hydrolase-like protein 2 n=1 Tax=Elsinoe australis TaxID=40998 RepID=A0A4U7B4H0_9PEZI|nr:ubiquitin carboxyl-terminal hydrolase-like protein 2 [Elsinoe australis]